IRDFHVTGVQTCALPIFDPGFAPRFTRYVEHRFDGGPRLFGQNAGGEPVVRCWMRTADRAPLDEDRLCFLLDAVFPVYFTALPQIGRASCRERVERSGSA